MTTKRRRAVVIGAGMAGLAAAKGLSAAMDEVVLVERDDLAGGQQRRPGVPQAPHVHSLLIRGKRSLMDLFPDLLRRLMEHGALELDLWKDFAILRPAGWAPRESAPERMLFSSRPFLEWAVRQDLALCSRVQFRDRARVTDLLWHQNGSVAGVRLDGDSAELEAELVVDASGRNTPLTQWFQNRQLPLPVAETVDPKSGYATCWYQAPTGVRSDDRWWKGIWIYAVPPEYPYTGILFPIENDRWVVTLIGASGQQPPTDERGFREALGRVRSPILKEAVERATPLDKVVGYRSLANVRRHYEAWKERPKGFLAVGDAACALNPFYGQGMSCAAESGRLLREWVMSERDEGAFLRKQARVHAAAWALSAGADRAALAGASGALSPTAKLKKGYLDALQEASIHDRELRTRFIEVVNMLRHPASLFAPSTCARVLYHIGRRSGPVDAARFHGSRPAPLREVPA